MVLLSILKTFLGHVTLTEAEWIFAKELHSYNVSAIDTYEPAWEDCETFFVPKQKLSNKMYNIYDW